jgi:hypothetical protein
LTVLDAEKADPQREFNGNFALSLFLGSLFASIGVLFAQGVNDYTGPIPRYQNPALCHPTRRRRQLIINQTCFRRRRQSRGCIGFIEAEGICSAFQEQLRIAKNVVSLQSKTDGRPKFAQSLGISALRHGLTFYDSAMVWSNYKKREATMLMLAIKIGAYGLSTFWAIQAVAYIAHLARIGVFRAVREDRAEKTLRLVS